MTTAKTNGRPRPQQPRELLDRAPPQELDAELAVLGSVISNSRVLDDLDGLLSTSDFYDEPMEAVFGVMLTMHRSGSPVDLVTLVSALKTAGLYERVGGAAFIARAAQSVPNAAHAVYYATIVRNAATKRRLLDASLVIARAAYDESDPEEALDRSEQAVLSVRDNRTESTCTKAARDVIGRTLENCEARQAGVETGVSTGFPDLDGLTGGLRESQVVIVAARPSMGKTAFACNTVEHVAIELSLPTLFISLEMSAEEVGERLLASRARVDLHKIRNGTFDANERSRMVSASSQIATAPFCIDDAPSRSIGSIAALARRHKRKHGLGLLVIDYLQLIAPDRRSESRQEAVADISRRIKVLARELRVPVICLSQLNRQADDATKDRRPHLSHLRESGAIEQDADVVMFVHRPGYFSGTAVPPGEGEEAELIVRKNRGGRTGTAKVWWFGAFVRFDSAASEFQ